MTQQRAGLTVNVSSHGSCESLMGVIYGVGKAGVEKAAGKLLPAGA